MTAIAALALVSGGAAAAELLYPGPVRVQLGDDPRWAAAELDDSEWTPTALQDAPEQAGPLWIRASVTLPVDMAAKPSPLGVFFAAMASHEIYWDGELIGSGGRVGRSAAEESPGPIEAQYVIPDHLSTPGTHTIAIRTSAFHRNFSPQQPWWGLIVGDYDHLLRARQTYTWIAMSSLSGILIGGFFALIMFLTDRRDRPFLVLAILCIVSSALLVAESWRSLFGYSYDLHIVRLVIVTVLSWMFNVTLVTFMATRFPLRDRWWILGTTAIVLLAPIPIFEAWDGKAGAMFMIGLGVSAIWSIVAVHRRMTASMATAIALGFGLALLIVAPFQFADLTLFFVVDFLVICLLAAHAVQVRRERRERDEALLRSARLETELLRRHIQPHFLMNTLTALTEWIDQDPETAARMIESLAEEFRLLSAIADRKLIPMRDEIRLCLLHLRLMSSRRNRMYELRVDGVDSDRLVPPAIFHTLVENAVTHGGNREETLLSLRAEVGGGKTRYIFDAPLETAVEPVPVEEKTGLRYIRARLEESFGSRWQLSHGPAGTMWRTEIVLPEGIET